MLANYIVPCSTTPGALHAMVSSEKEWDGEREEKEEREGE